MLFAGYRHCKKCGKPLMGLFDGALCDECEKAEQEPKSIIREAVEDYVCNYLTDTVKTQEILNTLQGMEQEPCDDAISRKDAIAEMEELNTVSFYEANEHSKEAYYEIKNMIKTIPPVTPSRHKGHWIPIYQGDEIINYHCSECELGDTNGSTNLYGWGYCRRCGAEMVSE